MEKNSCILLPDHKKHDNFQNIQLHVCLDKAIQKVTPLAYCQSDIQKNFTMNSHDYFQMKYPQFHSKFLNLKLHLPYMLQQKYHSFLE